MSQRGRHSLNGKQYEGLKLRLYGEIIWLFGYYLVIIMVIWRAPLVQREKRAVCGVILVRILPHVAVRQNSHMFEFFVCVRKKSQRVRGTRATRAQGLQGLHQFVRLAARCLRRERRTSNKNSNISLKKIVAGILPYICCCCLR